MHNLIAVLSFNRNAVNECNELQKQLQDGLITETEFAKALIDLTMRKQALPLDQLEEIAKAAFPYSVATGSYESDGSENCKYCDDFATMRDAIIAWEHYAPGCAWARVEHCVDDFIYALDPYKIRRAKVVDDNGKKRTLFMQCNANGEFTGE